jgi:hypothetical protein
MAWTGPTVVAICVDRETNVYLSAVKGFTKVQAEAREVRSIEDRSLRRKLHAILTKAGKRLEQDDNFPHLVTSGRGRIADEPPLI